MISKVTSVISLKCSKVILWTDSKIVLSWNSSSPAHWTTFVAKRVSKIQNLTTNYEWHHVNSEENPADYLSRGIQPSDILAKSQWWHGPDFLFDFNLVVKPIEVSYLETLTEQRKTVHTHLITESTFPWSRFSNFSRLQRCLAYCLRSSTT